MGGSSSSKAATIGQDVEEEIRHGLFCWARYLNGRDACLCCRPRRRGGSREQDFVDGRRKDFIAETMAILEANPDVTEVLVERVKPQRFAEARGEYNAFFNASNDRAMAARANEW
jgi:hypothetical protein